MELSILIAALAAEVPVRQRILLPEPAGVVELQRPEDVCAPHTEDLATGPCSLVPAYWVVRKHGGDS